MTETPIRLFGRLMCFFFRHKPKFLTYNSYPCNGVWMYGCERCDMIESAFWLRRNGYDIEGLHNRYKDTA